jgi:hypothetical protein
MAIPKSGSFYVAECLVVVTDSPAPETVTIIDAVTFGTKAIVAMSKKEIVLGIPKLEEDKYSFLWLCSTKV